MAKVPIQMPQLGESIAEATIVRILFNAGDAVQADTDLIEVETNKAVMAVTAPCSGTIQELTTEIGTSYPVGAILGLADNHRDFVQAKLLGRAPAAFTGNQFKAIRHLPIDEQK